MTDVSALIMLPVSVGSSILSDWVPEKTLGKLDVAYCNHANRELFLEVLCSIRGLEVNYVSKCAITGSKVRWMISRQVRCISFCCWGNPPGDHDPILSAFFQSTASGIQLFILHCDETTASRVLNLLALSGHSLMEQAHLQNILADAENDPACLLVRQYGGSWPRHLCFAHGRAYFQLLEVDVLNPCDAALIEICRAATNLRMIRIDRPRCTGAAFAAIGQCCRDLKILVVWNAWVSGEVPDIDKGFAAIAMGCRKLEGFYIEDCATMTDAGVCMIMEHCSRIKEVHFLSNDHITDACLTALAHSAGGYLQSLVMRECTALTGTGVLAIATHCPALHTLDLGISESIDTLSMQLAIPYWKRMTTLDLFKHIVTDVTLTLISVHMPRLVDLSVGTGDIPQYTIVGVTEVVQRCEKLERLHVADEIVFRDGEVLLKQIRPGL